MKLSCAPSIVERRIQVRVPSWRKACAPSTVEFQLKGARHVRQTLSRFEGLLCAAIEQRWISRPHFCLGLDWRSKADVFSKMQLSEGEEVREVFVCVGPIHSHDCSGFQSYLLRASNICSGIQSYFQRLVDTDITLD